MVSYEALIQIFMLVVDVLTLAVMTIALFKKTKPPSLQASGLVS